MDKQFKRFKRIFLIVADSAGIGEEPDADLFGDCGSNTWAHAADSVGGLCVPNMEAMGIGELDEIKGVKKVSSHPLAYSLACRETSKGKDTMTGHWEMMGINTTKPFQTFTDTGFPKELIDELEKETGHRVIGNKAASGTEILDELGEEQIKENAIIVYTSADSVLQIAANEDHMALSEIYRCCEIARGLTMRSEWFVGRVIARPYVGEKKGKFKRVGAHRHDYTVSPSNVTALDILKKNGYTVSGIGKINDIFNGVGITKTIHTASNEEGMDEAIRQLKEDDWTGLCFVNLVEFDSEYGHRRNPVGYARCLEAFDKRVGEFIANMGSEDLLLITADHGNDPIFKGTDHTREKVPLLCYCPSFKNGRKIEEQPTFAVMGDTILSNFYLKKDPTMLGTTLDELLED